MKKIRAFTLFELLIVLSIIGILMALAYPSYRDYVIRAARSDAYVGIKNMALRMERQYAVRNAYTAMPATLSPEGYYTVSGVTGIVDESSCTSAVDDNSATFSYTVIALPVAGKSQELDENCACLLLTSTGVKGAINSGGSSADCW